MLNSHRVLDNERKMRACTGLNQKALNELCESFGKVYEKTLSLEVKPLKRSKEGGREPRLRGIEDQLFVHLILFRYPTFDVLGVLFDPERGRTHRSTILREMLAES
jgi:hypothetical protein